MLQWVWGVRKNTLRFTKMPLLTMFVCEEKHTDVRRVRENKIRPSSLPFDYACIRKNRLCLCKGKHTKCSMTFVWGNPLNDPYVCGKTHLGSLKCSPLSYACVRKNRLCLCEKNTLNAPWRLCEESTLNDPYVRSRTKLGTPGKLPDTYNNTMEIFWMLHVCLEILCFLFLKSIAVTSNRLPWTF